MSNLKKTERGFGYIEFTDRYNQKCSFQESSIATEECIWLGVDVDLKGAEVNNRMHLTREQAGEVGALLAQFAEEGWAMFDKEPGR